MAQALIVLFLVEAVLFRDERSPTKGEEEYARHEIQAWQLIAEAQHIQAEAASVDDGRAALLESADGGSLLKRL